MQTKMNLWVGGLVFGVVVLLGAGWILLIAPALDEVYATVDQTEQAQARNDSLTAQNATLKRQFADISSLRSDLSDLQEQVPPTPDLDDFLRAVGDTATEHEVFIVSVTPSAASSFTQLLTDAAVNSVNAGVTPATTETAEAAEAPAEGEAAADGTAAAPATSSAMAISVTIEMVGPYQNTLDMLSELQADDSRLLLVTAIDAAGTKESPATGGRPATARGDLNITVTGYILVQPGTNQDPVEQEAPAQSTGGGLAPGS